MRRWLVGLIIVAVTLAMPSPVSGASGIVTGECGRIDLRYMPSRVAPGQLMAMEFTVWNCSEMAETLLVRAHPTGPCRFIHPEEASYTLEPGMALTQIADFFAPECPGRYRVRVALFLEDMRLDSDGGRFLVEEEG
jgi:hypothetical protein